MTENDINVHVEFFTNNQSEIDSLSDGYFMNIN